MPADLDSLFGDDDYNFDDDPIEDGFDDTTVAQSIDHDDGFDDMIRQQAARSETSYEGLEDDTDDYFEAEGNSGGFSLGNFTPIQRLIIIALILLNILAFGFGVLILTGNFG